MKVQKFYKRRQTRKEINVEKRHVNKKGLCENFKKCNYNYKMDIRHC